MSHGYRHGAPHAGGVGSIVMREVNIETVWGRAWTGPVLALLLALDLPLLPWIDHSVAGISRLTPATGMPQPWLGAIALIACAAIVLEFALASLTAITPPALGGDRERTRALAATVAAAALGLKFVLHLNHVGDLGIGCWLALALAAALVARTFPAIAGRSPESASS